MRKFVDNADIFSNLFFQQINSTPSQDGEQNGLMGRVDEGVDEFFSKKVTKMSSRSELSSFWTTFSDDLTQLYIKYDVDSVCLLFCCF